MPTAIAVFGIVSFLFSMTMSPFSLVLALGGALLVLLWAFFNYDITNKVVTSIATHEYDANFQGRQNDIGSQQDDILLDAAIFFSFAFLCGVNPLLIKKFVPTNVNRNTVILAQDLIKLVISLVVLFASPSRHVDVFDWTWCDALWAAGIPSSLFVIQSNLNLFANQILSPTTYVVILQTKIIWTAWFCYLILGLCQSEIQIFALGLVTLAMLWVQKTLAPSLCTKQNCTENKDGNKDKYEDNDKLEEPLMNDENRRSEPGARDDVENASDRKLVRRSQRDIAEEEGDIGISTEKYEEPRTEHDRGQGFDQDVKNGKKKILMLGFAAALSASVLSGLSASLTQQTLQIDERDPFLFNVELSLVSITILAFCILASSFSSLFPSHGTTHESQSVTSVNIAGFDSMKAVLKDWKLSILIPVMVNAISGMLIGLVTKRLGALYKSFATMLGIVISAFLQKAFPTESGLVNGLSSEEAFGVFLCVVSLWLHTTNPIE